MISQASVEHLYWSHASHVVVMVENPPASAGHVRVAGSIPASERSPGRGQGNPLQYSCLENPTDRGAWPAAVPRVPQSLAQLNDLARMHALVRIGYASVIRKAPQS